VVLVALFSTRPAAASPTQGGLTWRAEQPGRAHRALLSARLTRSLKQARSDYARSQFEACFRRLERSEQDLRGQVRHVEIAQLKQLNLWLGLCLAVEGKATAAERVFFRAVQLGGADPDPNLFPPSVMQSYQQVKERSRKAACPLKLEAAGGAEVRVNGRPAGAMVVAPGEHYVQWGGHSELLTVDERCSLTLPELAVAPLTFPRFSAAEAADGGFLQQVGQSAGVQRMRLAQDPQSKQHRTFDVALARFVVVSPSSKPVPPPVTPWYKRWWVWGLVGAGVVTAVVVPVVIVNSRDNTSYQISF